MLLKLKLENVFSIKKAEIDFTKARYLYKSNMLYNDLIVNPIAIYGYNSSGKSSIFKTMAFLTSFLLEGDNYPLEVNMLEAAKKIKEKQEGYSTSYFRLYFKIDNDYYEYNLAYNNAYIKEELIQNNKMLINRILDTYTIYFYEGRAAKTKLINKSILLELKDKITTVYDYLSNISIILDNRINTITKILTNKNIYDLFYENQEAIYNSLNELPFVLNFKIVKDKYTYQLEYDNNYLPISYLSKGTFNVFLIMSLILSSPKNSLLFIDDLDSNIHPFILDRIINLANDNNIQLVFSSHNTHLMQMLRPDQIYFASFNESHSSYKRLSDIKDNIREINNIEKMYLSYVFIKEV